MKKVSKKILSLLCAAAMICMMLPVSVLAAPGDVAQIGNTTYATLDEAIEAAVAGDTIVLLEDAAATKTFYKSLTFTGGHTVSMNVYGWRYTGDLVFDGANLNINTDATSPVANNGEAAQWFTMVLSGSITAKNGANITFTFDSACGTNCAIYTGSKGVTINVENNSKFSIYGKNTKGVTGQGIQLDSTANTGIYVTGKSEFLIDGTNRGYVNSPTIYVEDSTFTVQNCTSNASNGGTFTAADDAKIYFLNNAGHGLSATNLTVTDSTLTANHNGYYGVYASNSLSVDSTSKVIVTENSYNGDYAGLKVGASVTSGIVKSGAEVTINNNYCSGLSNAGTCVFEEGVDLTVMYNVNDKGTSSYGGGVYNTGSSLTLPSDAKIYNNHAVTAGDDIYSKQKITFGSVGEGWSLDGAPDCNDKIHAIDGWYEDGATGTRWLADTDVVDDQHVELTAAGTITGLTALKAAHGLDPEITDPDGPDDKTSYPSLDKAIVENGSETNKTSVSKGDTVNFKLTSNVPQDLTNYLEADPIQTYNFNSELNNGFYYMAFHDTMDKGLTLVENSIKLIINGKEVPYSEDNDALYFVTIGTDTNGNTTIDVEFNLAAIYATGGYFTEAEFGTAPIILTYSATVDQDITVGTYYNRAWVEYEGGHTAEDAVEVDTYGIKIFKYDQADPTKGLAGAVFELKDSTGKVIATLTSGADGCVTYEGLKAGTYTLTETKAPSGYVKSDTPLTVTINDGLADYIVSVKFANSNIPHTGGMGTTMFTVGGGLLIAAAGVMLIARKKRENA